MSVELSRLKLGQGVQKTCRSSDALHEISGTLQQHKQPKRAERQVSKSKSNPSLLSEFAIRVCTVICSRY